LLTADGALAHGRRPCHGAAEFRPEPQHQVMASMERLMREVMRRVRERIGAASAVA
jgi:hypothetical protein